MYLNGVICRKCSECIFYCSPRGFVSICSACDPEVQLRWVSHFDFKSDPSLASAYNVPCDRYINFMDHLADLRAQFEGVAK